MSTSAPPPEPGPPKSLPALLARYRDRRLAAVFVFGMASGFPWVLLGSAMSAWLQELGVSRSAIGLLGVVGAVYALNFLWAPLLDRFVPRLGAGLDRRRAWIVLMQVLLLLTTFSISLIDPGANLLLTGLLLLLLATFSATQDVAIDAYRVDLIPRRDQSLISYGAAMATSGWWTGYGLLGAVPFLLVDRIAGSWNAVYVGLALVWLPFLAFALRVAPAARAGSEAPRGAGAGGVFRELRETVLAPLIEFFRRNGVALALGLLTFVLLFKVGEAFLGRMAIVFYKEIGFTNAEIGTYSKVLNWWVTVIFSVIGSLLNARFGILRGLVVGGIAMASTNLMFAWIAQIGPQPWLLAVTVVVDGFTAALGTVAFMAFITSLTSHTFTATQYALLASIGNLGRTLLASSGGTLVDWLGGDWATFFVLTALAVLPSLVLLRWLSPSLHRRYPAAFGPGRRETGGAG
jgi:PAT family beta-lactamase induction signal transducer AmpG